MKPTKVVLVLLFGLYHVLGMQMDWRSQPDLVDEFNPIQGRENYKLLVAMVGIPSKLICEVDFASKPVKKIVWEIDGKPQTRKKTQEEEDDTESGKVFIVDTFDITNITEEMDDKRVSCVYDDESVEAILHVFKLEIDKIQENVCDTCEGDVKLRFKEGVRSKSGENNVEERIKANIFEMIKVTPNDKNSEDEYSVTLPIADAKFNQEVTKMNQDLQLCCQKQHGPEIDNNNDDPKQLKNSSGLYTGIGVGVGSVLLACTVAIIMVVKKKMGATHEDLQEDGRTNI